MRRPYFRLLVLALFASTAACGALDAEHDDDEGIDSDLLESLDKADSVACAGYPGGTLSGDDLLVLVNKRPGQQLASNYVPANLRSIDAKRMMPGQRGKLRDVALKAFEELASAAATEKRLDLRIRSPYRSFRDQCITFDYKVSTNGLAHAERYSARPGRSQHQLGTTIDITAASVGWQLTPRMANVAEGRWLAANAHRFGFALSYPQDSEAATGYAYEPWHYRFIGRAAATELHESGELLEDYLRRCQLGDEELSCPRR